MFITEGRYDKIFCKKMDGNYALTTENVIRLKLKHKLQRLAMGVIKPESFF